MLRVILAFSLFSGCAMPDPFTAHADLRQECFEGWQYACDHIRDIDTRAFGRPSVCPFRWC